MIGQKKTLCSRENFQTVVCVNCGLFPLGEALLLRPLRELVKALNTKLSSNAALRQKRATYLTLLC